MHVVEFVSGLSLTIGHTANNDPKMKLTPSPYSSMTKVWVPTFFSSTGEETLSTTGAMLLTDVQSSPEVYSRVRPSGV